VRSKDKHISNVYELYHELFTEKISKQFIMRFIPNAKYNLTLHLFHFIGWLEGAMKSLTSIKINLRERYKRQRFIVKYSFLVLSNVTEMVVGGIIEDVAESFGRQYLSLHDATVLIADVRKDTIKDTQYEANLTFVLKSFFMKQITKKELEEEPLLNLLLMSKQRLMFMFKSKTGKSIPLSVEKLISMNHNDTRKQIDKFKKLVRFVHNDMSKVYKNNIQDFLNNMTLTKVKKVMINDKIEIEIEDEKEDIQPSHQNGEKDADEIGKSIIKSLLE